MKITSEEDIASVLNALRDIQPTDGMESRILLAIERRTSARPAWLHWIQPMQPIQWTLAALATAAIVLAISLTTYNSHAPTPTIAQSALPTTLPFKENVIPKEHVILSSAKDPLLPRAHTNSQYPPHQLVCDCDRLAMEETQAPSHPAPPLPLTRDERLLLRAAQRGEPIQIAELEPFAVAPKEAATPKKDDAFKEVVQRFLKQVAAAEALNPTTPSSDSNDSSPSVDSPH